VLALGGGVASASTSGWSIVGAPVSLAQNTQGNEFITDGKVVSNNSSRTFTTAAETAPNTVVVTTPTPDLTQGDVGRAITGSGIPPGTYIEAVTAANTLTTSRPITTGTYPVTITASITGAGAALSFNVPSWTAGETIAISVAPDDGGLAGQQCATNPQPGGVNQTDAQSGNYVGFSKLATYLGTGTGNTDDGHGVVPPLVDGAGIPNGPHFTFSQTGLIPCSTSSTGNPLGTAGDGSLPLPAVAQPSLSDGAYTTLVLTFTDSGSNGTVTLGQGVSQSPLPDASGPLLFDVGFGATTGPVHLSVDGVGEIPSNVTVVGQTPSAYNPPSPLTRNTATDFVSGPVSEFKIADAGNSLPPNDGTLASNPQPINTFNPLTHTLQASAPGGVCLVLDNGQHNSLNFDLGANGWSVSANAGTAGFSAAAGSAVVDDNNSSVFLPVTSQSNAPATWTTSGLAVSGVARADGPVYAWAYWLQGSVDPETGVVTPPNSNSCPSATTMANPESGSPAYTLGYVQITTIRELANSVFGANAEATAAQAVDHQFDSAKGTCVSNTVGPDFFFGSSIFLPVRITTPTVWVRRMRLVR